MYAETSCKMGSQLLGSLSRYGTPMTIIRVDLAPGFMFDDDVVLVAMDGGPTRRCHCRAIAQHFTSVASTHSMQITCAFGQSALGIVVSNDWRGPMFVDTDLLCIGARFSQSAGEIVQGGAHQLASTQPTAGIFGDFDAAHRFDRALSRAHQGHTTTMEAHRVEFDALVEKTTAAAAMFTKRDEMSASEVESAGRDFG